MEQEHRILSDLAEQWIRVRQQLSGQIFFLDRCRCLLGSLEQIIDEYVLFLPLEVRIDITSFDLLLPDLRDKKANLVGVEFFDVGSKVTHCDLNCI
jgi:hypothetical protein